MSTSESTSSEPKKSTSESTKDAKVKRGPGRPPKTERLMSSESLGDEDVFVNDSEKHNNDKKSKGGQKNSTTADQQGMSCLCLSNSLNGRLDQYDFALFSVRWHFQ